VVPEGCANRGHLFLGEHVARIRTIKPEFFKNSRLHEAEIAAGLPLRLAFAGLWCCADREGRFRWKSKELKLDCLPYDDVDFEAVMVALERNDNIRSYVVDGKKFGYIPAWSDHQIVNARETPSVLPEPPCQAGPTSTDGARNADASATGEPRVPDASTTRHGNACEEGKGKEGKGKEGKDASTTDAPSPTSGEAPSGFALTGKGKAKPPVNGHRISLKTFFERCEAADEEPIPASDAVFRYAERAAIPETFLHLAWKEFRRKHIDTPKQYVNWRMAFRNCVEQNWYKLWAIDREGQYFLTSAGKQAQKANGA
jgi:hypothetical protein